MDFGTTLMLGVVFSAIGMGYFVYGKKQAKIGIMLTGIALCVLPYWATNPYVLLGGSILLIAVPFVVRF